MNRDGLKTEIRGAVARLKLSRVEVHNAFDAPLINVLEATFEEISQDERVRVVVLEGEGKNFCAGADIHWMKNTIDCSEEENVEDAMRLHQMLERIYFCPKPVITRVQGVALGGGTGLVACSDISIASSDAKFGLSEARLGILPAAISPFVVRKIGMGALKAYGLSAKRMTAEEALRIGLIQEISDPSNLDSTVDRWVKECLQNGPQAMANAKMLYDEISGLDIRTSAQKTTRAIAKARVGEEGQEGLKAFLEKRTPKWRIQ